MRGRERADAAPEAGGSRRDHLTIEGPSGADVEPGQPAARLVLDRQRWRSQQIRIRRRDPLLKNSPRAFAILGSFLGRAAVIKIVRFSIL